MGNAKKTPMLMGWHEEFEQHKEIIDEQHRAILATINSIHYLFMKADDADIIKHIMMLHSQMQMHFKTELLILKQHESPFAEPYEQHAKAFLDSLLDVCDTPDEHQTQQLFEKFKAWWHEHMTMHEDITPYLFKWEGEFCRVVA